jgi:hypothetical protein
MHLTYLQRWWDDEMFPLIYKYDYNF